MKNVYNYYDETRERCFRVTVIRQSDGSKTVFQEHVNEKGDWVLGMEGVRRFPYHLPEALLALHKSEVIYIVEGEKDVQTLTRLGLTATTNVGGALKWRDEDSALFVGGRFVVIGDNDDIGRKHADMVVASLLRCAKPSSLKLIDLSALKVAFPEKGDVTTYMESGGTLDGLLKAIENATERAYMHDSVNMNEPDDGDMDTEEQEFVLDVQSCDLPKPLDDIIEAETDSQDKLTVLWSCLASVSALLPKFFMRIAGRPIYPNLYVFICGKAGSGKGLMSVGRDLVSLVNREMLQDYEYKLEAYKVQQSAYERARATRKTSGSDLDIEAPAEPTPTCLIAPGDATAPIILQRLRHNASILISETEADVVATLTKPDYGDFSGALRQAWSHESIGYARVKLGMPILIDCPRLSILLSGTPRQLVTFLRDTENGLASRFVVHWLMRRSSFKNPYDPTVWKGQSLGVTYAPAIKALHNAVTALGENSIEVRFSAKQMNELGQYLKFADALNDDESDYLSAFSRRTPITVARIAMILSVLRAFDENRLVPGTMEVDDRDYDTAMKLGHYIRHVAGKVLAVLPEQAIATTPRQHGAKEPWYVALPEVTTSIDAVILGHDHGIARRSIFRYLKDPELFTRLIDGTYCKRRTGQLMQWRADS